MLPKNCPQKDTQHILIVYRHVLVRYRRVPVMYRRVPVMYLHSNLHVGFGLAVWLRGRTAMLPRVQLLVTIRSPVNEHTPTNNGG